MKSVIREFCSLLWDWVSFGLGVALLDDGHGERGVHLMSAKLEF